MRLITFLLLFVFSHSFSQKIELFADLEKNEIDTELNFLTSFNGNIYFYEQTNGLNKGIYKSDGTEAGTTLLKNLYNFFGSNCTGIYAGTNKIIFSSVEDIYNRLYISDGTPAGTILIHQNSSLKYSNFIENNGFIYFTIGGNSLWKTDGTSAGTVLVKNNISVSNFYSFNNTLYFVGYSSATGYELWKSDGTAEGTNMVVDFGSGAEHGIQPTSKVIMHQNTLYYNLNYSIIKFDMLTQTTTVFVTLINSFNQYKTPEDFLIKDNDLYVIAVGLIDGNLYKYNLSTTTLTRLRENGSISFFDELTVYNGNVYCSGLYGLIKSDGTINGTVGVSGTYDSNNYYFNINSIKNGKVFNSYLYYLRYKVVGGKYFYALWKTDGTPGGSSIVKEYPNVVKNNNYINDKFEEAQGKLFFYINDGVNGREVHKSDGTTSGTGIIKNLGTPNVNESTSQYKMSEFDGKFLIQDNRTTYALDTISKTTTFLADIGDDSEPFKYNNKLYLDGRYRVNDNLTGVENFCSYCYSPIVFQNKIFLNKDEELYSYDGTTFNLVRDINLTGSSSPINLGVINNKLILTAYHPDYGRELWVSDGTEEGTHLIKDIIAGKSGLSNNIRTQFVYNNLLLFEIYNNRYELWRTDGTEEGTFCISTNLANNYSGYYSFTVYNNKCYFTTNRKVCVTDGTLGETKFINGTYSYVADLPYFSISNNKLYFIGNKANSGDIIFSIQNDVVTPVSKLPDTYINAESLFAYDERTLIFSEDDDNFIESFSLLDSKTNQTTFLKKIGSFIQTKYKKVNKQVFFYINDKVHGGEFWVIRFPKCQDGLNITTSYTNSTIRLNANYTITASNKISGGNLTYRSGDVISLNPGFKVENGGVFKAEIGKCESY
ncbi:3-coathanger stack domain-containing protein [Emticicia fontis]